MRGKKAKMLRRLALILPKVNINHLVTKSEIVHADQDGNKFEKPMRKITRTVEPGPVNHYRNLKGIYKKHGILGAYAYGNEVVSYSHFLQQQQKPNEERNQNQEDSQLQPGTEEDSVLQVQGVVDGDGGDNGSL